MEGGKTDVRVEGVEKDARVLGGGLQGEDGEMRVDGDEEAAKEEKVSPQARDE